MIDLGPIQVPVPLPDIALTDRADGTVWALQNDGTDRIKIVTPPPTGFRGKTYPALAGPRVSTRHGTAQLLVRGGVLGYEIDGSGVTARPVYAPAATRSTAAGTVFEIVAPADMARGGALGYQTEPDL